MATMTKQLWMEDYRTRGTPGHERLHEAWQRLFGTVLREQTPTAEIDHGDASETQYGSISVWCMQGAYYVIEQRYGFPGDGPELIAPAVATVLDRVRRELTQKEDDDAMPI